ncbi:unnamed protein product [Arabis nemorensis]|uniref:Uncharacterized protein n=1 Tax=Arabis nemorensis TaxID=586526 RepID=A0A565B9D2_9BRAS|nr:unnamed protein product [Arabis nemorensis]
MLELTTKLLGTETENHIALHEDKKYNPTPVKELRPKRVSHETEASLYPQMIGHCEQANHVWKPGGVMGVAMCISKETLACGP